MDVTKTLETFDDLGNIAVDGITLVKKGISFASFGAIIDLLGQVKELVADAPMALPELMDLDAAEAAQVGQAAYVVVSKIMVALKS